MSIEIASQQANVVTEESTPQTPSQLTPEQPSAPPDVTPETPSTSTTPPATTPPPDESPGSEPAKKGRIEVSADTIEDLKAQRKRRQEAEKEAAYWRGVAEGTGGRGRATPQPMPEPEPPTVLTPPRPEEFTDFASYESAKEEYLLAKAEERAIARMQQQTMQSREEAIRRTYDERIAKAAEVDPDLPDIIADNTLPINPPMARIIRESEFAPQLIRYFNDNRKEALRLYHMDPVLAGREIGRIEERLEAREKATPPPKKISAAPEPIPTVGARGTQELDEDRIPVDDWMKRRNAKQFARK